MRADRPPVITIDGPAGSGKGTIAMRLAEHLGWHYLDSGALYRLVAVAAMDRGIAADDAKALGRLAHELDISFGTHGGTVTIQPPAGVGIAVVKPARRVARICWLRSAGRKQVFLPPSHLVAWLGIKSLTLVCRTYRFSLNLRYG